MRLVLLAICGVLALQLTACGVKRGLKTPEQIEREEQKKAKKEQEKNKEAAPPAEKK
jgi:predicted small lipoprotein YifL